MSADTESEPAALRFYRATEPPKRQHRHQTKGEGEWTHESSKHCVWRKIHVGIDEKALEVRAVEVTNNNMGDAPVFPKLLN